MMMMMMYDKTVKVEGKLYITGYDNKKLNKNHNTAVSLHLHVITESKGIMAFCNLYMLLDYKIF